MSDVESTLLIVKPDAVRRGLIGEILSRVERKGLGIDDLRMMTVSRDLAERHYAEHREKPFFAPLVDFITSGPLVAAVVEGPRAIEAFRQLAGATDPIKATTGSIRADHALEVQSNIVHGSDSPESAKREIALFFPTL